MRKLVFLVLWCSGIMWSMAIKAGLLDNCSAANPSGCVTKHVPGKTMPGYVYIDAVVSALLGDPNFPPTTYLIDRDGNVVKDWPLVFFSKFLPGGNVLGGLVYQTYAGPPVELGTH